MTKQKQDYIIENCISNGQLMNEKQIMNSKKFHYIDFYYILCRSMKSSMIREWHLQFLKASCLFGVAILFIILYPNLIGSDPSCSIDLSSRKNLTQMTQSIYDAINGKRSNGEINVSYLIVLFLGFGLVYIECITFVFPDEIKVINKY